jgi:hypothetical protein
MRAPWATNSSSVMELPEPGALLDEHLVAVGHEFAHADRGDADAELVVLDLAGDTDLHGDSPH